MNLINSDYETHLYLDAFWRKRYLFLLSLIIMPILAVLSSHFLPKKYTARTSIAININALPAMKDISTPTDISDRFEGLKAYISSPAILKEIVIDVGLVKKSASKALIQSAVDQVQNGLTISLLDKSAIEINLVLGSPRYVADILNMMSKRLIQQLNAQEIGIAKTSLTVLSTSLAAQKEKLRQAEELLSNYEKAHADLLPGYSDIYQAQLRQINLDLGSQQAQYSDIQAEAQELEQSILKINPMITQLDRAIFDNDMKLNKLRLTYTDDYFGIKELIKINQSLNSERERIKKQYQELDEDKIQQLWSIVLSASTDTKGNGNVSLLSTQLEKLLNMQLKLKGMAKKITDLTEQQKSIIAKLQFLTDSKQTYTKLQDSIKDSQGAYNDTLNRYNLAKMSIELSQNEESSIAKVVSYPDSQLHSLARPIYFFLFLGIVSGIFFGLSLIIVLELIDNKARNKRAVEAVTGFEVICRVERLGT